MFSIVIPTYNNLDYLKLCLMSLEKNSKFNHELVVHINSGSDGTIDFIEDKKINYSYSENNIGLCSAINKAVKLTKKKYVLYSHDDMYFCPNWDEILLNEIETIKHDNFYLSGTMIQKDNGHINFDCGDSPDNFDEEKFLNNYKNVNFYDHQGSHFAPHLCTRELWDRVGGFSEEFNPGLGSDPDFNMKLWNEGVRIFKGINNFKVYHFSTVTTKKKSGVNQNNGKKTFLLKWGISISHFAKYYMQRQEIYHGPLKVQKNVGYFFSLLISKLKIPYYLIFKR